MGDERRDDASERRRADVYSSARIGAASALTLVLVALLVLDVAVPGYEVSPTVLLPLLGAILALLAAAGRATGLPIDRAHVLAHADINSVSRASDPWPASTRETYMARIIARANAILRPPIVTVTVKPGDTLSGIAKAHALTLAALLAFPENARYRTTPGLIHPGDVVRVK